MASGPFIPSLLLATSLCAQGYVDITAPAGLGGIPHSTATWGTGLCAADFDGDGDHDLFVPGVPGAPIQYFRNDGGLVFSDQSAGANLGIGLSPQSCTVADIDNDGDADILLGNLLQPMQLFINDGSGHFSEDAQARGLTAVMSVHGATFGDYDRDGWLDVYVSNRGTTPNRLYRNLGGGVFQDVTTSTRTGHTGFTFLSAFVDYDEDLWPDIYCVNDRGLVAGPNVMLRNNGDGTFTDVSAAINASHAIEGMGVDFTDVFNDGGVDIYCADFPVDHLFLHWKPQLGQYDVDQYVYGIQGGGTGWAVHWLDHDNDGWQDLHVVDQNAGNILWRNPGAPASQLALWTDVAPAIGLMQFYPQFTALTADFDNDGGIDILQRFGANPIFQSPTGASLHHNQVPRGNWLKVRTTGVVSNRDGFGARVEVLTGTNRQRQWVRSGVGFQSDNDRRVHFGLGSATQADEVLVTWPSGQVQRLENVTANQILEVVEPSFELVGTPAIGSTTRFDLSVPGDAGLPSAIVLAFSDQPRTMLPDGRFLPLLLDALSGYTIIPGNALVPASLGTLDPNAQASSTLVLPNQPSIVGLQLFATAATFEAAGFPFVRTIFPEPVTFTIQ
jgi:hypothetical protein